MRKIIFFSKLNHELRCTLYIRDQCAIYALHTAMRFVQIINNQNIGISMLDHYEHIKMFPKM